MASEIRVNKIENRSGLGTVTFADTGVDLAGIVTATTFSGSGASLTNIPDSALSAVTASKLTGALPAISGASLTGMASTDNVRTGILDVAGISTFRNTMNVGAAVTISESGIEASGIGITVANINGGSISGRRNLIINGAMNVAQRGTVTSITSSQYAGPDRFRFGIASHGTFTVSQDSSAPTGSGFANSLKLDCTTADTSVASSAAGYFQHKIEGQDCQLIKKGTSSAEQLTVQFWVKSNKTGTYAFQLSDNDNSRSFTTTYSISSADTWEKKTITIPADTTGALDDDNNVSLTFNFWLVAGTDYTSGSASTTWYSSTNANAAKGHAVNIADSTSNEWYMTGFQVEIGSQATSFEHRSFGEELRLCQRYYFRLENDSSTTCHLGTMQYYGSSAFFGFLMNLPVEMRAIPTATLSGSGKPWSAGGNANGSFTSLSLNKNSKTSLSTNGSTTSGSGGTNGYATVITLLQSSYIDADAEL